MVQQATLQDRSAGKRVALALELRRPLVDPTSSRGSVVLLVDLHHGRSTNRVAVPHPGSNAQLLLDLLEEALFLGRDLEAMATATTAAVIVAVIAVLRRGSSREVMTTMADTAVMEVEVEDTDREDTEDTADMPRLRHLEARLLGCNSSRMQVTAPQAWTTTMVPHRHHLLVERLLHHPPATSHRRLLRRHSRDVVVRSNGQRLWVHAVATCSFPLKPNNQSKIVRGTISKNASLDYVRNQESVIIPPLPPKHQWKHMISQK